MATQNNYDFTDKYNTVLSPEEEKQFTSEFPDKSNSYDYDLRGAWKKGLITKDGRGHLTDEFKKPNHPTFSDESIYNKVDGYEGGQWQEDKKGKWKFVAPSKGALSAEQLQRYFKEKEPDAELVMPPSRVLYGDK